MSKKRISDFSSEDMKHIIEALVFAADEPLSLRELRVLIEGEPAKLKKKKSSAIGAMGEELPDLPALMELSDDDDSQTENTENVERSVQTAQETNETPQDEEKSSALNARTIRALIDELNKEYEQRLNAFRIVEIAGGFQFATQKEYGLFVGRLRKDKTRRRLSQAGLEVLAIVAYRQPIPKPEIESIRGVNCDEVIQSLMEKDLITITGRAESVGRPLLFGTTEIFLKYFGLASLHDLPRPREIEEMLESNKTLPAQLIMEIPSTDNAQEVEDHLAPQHKESDSEFTTEMTLIIEGKNEFEHPTIVLNPEIMNLDDKNSEE